MNEVIKTMEDRRSVTQGFVDVHTLQPKLLIAFLVANLLSLAVVFHQFWVSVPILFGSHTNRKVIRKGFVETLCVSD